MATNSTVVNPLRALPPDTDPGEDLELATALTRLRTISSAWRKDREPCRSPQRNLPSSRKSTPITPMSAPYALPLPPKQLSLLFRLPPEVRNLIYEHALTFSERPLRLCEDYLPQHTEWPGEENVNYTLYAILSNGIHQEFNRLKYVCRELWTETAGLEAKYNRILVLKGELADCGAIPSFLRFAETCSPEKLSWLRRIDIRTTCGPDSFLADYASDFSDLADFCYMHPRTQVRYILPGFPNYTFFPTLDWQIIATCTLYKWAFCDVDMRPLAPSIPPYDTDLPLDDAIHSAKEWRGIYTMRDISARNLICILPDGHTNVDETDFPDSVGLRVKKLWVKLVRHWGKFGLQADDL
ncbi:hypothetical protein EJ04DRAFT_568013 [Polyplosphaeria fusca]|uniref:Uncharacterized protein n=1 Tax=Polyplosphaeria fusca TaxID=682080 RepID=A0A9P4QRJ3_9PLEO|nr:hypothetical protein EJ04DRAFT_568013 [Polyplosphaeria fusca]